ncbi:MAG TPA: tannase/feruloyl esterase family alpha/beta hydrolase [Marmoricola sp.]|nr:tannase/feruloyl esterase family alpha/beta hydrolase [Marmoricola sp.]
MPSLGTTLRLAATALTTLVVTTGLLTAPAGAQPPDVRPRCAGTDSLSVPGADRQVVSCLADLTTAGTVVSGHTDKADWSGLHASGTRNPSGVPGIQVDGYFPDDSTSNTNHGWNHDSQFVIRLPHRWNGKVVVSGAPGTREQYAGDFIFSDWLVAQGYAYAMTDKGNGGATFHHDGREPSDAVAEWNHRVTELTRAVKNVVAQRYHRQPRRTYLFGISNGGYLVRWQLENRPELYDGGVDWEGTLFRSDPPNLLSYLPTALREYPAYRAGDPAAHRAMLDAGFAPGSEFTWDFHHTYYWDLTQRVYREEFDPTWDGDLDAGIPFCVSGTPSCDADYDYDSRPSAHRAMEKVALTGRIRRPMITLHGTYDALLPIALDSDVYDRMIERQGADRLHRFYRFEAGVHTDGLHDLFGDRVRPLLPCARASFSAMTRWVERHRTPPRDTTRAQPGAGADQVNGCALG